MDTARFVLEIHRLMVLKEELEHVERGYESWKYYTTVSLYLSGSAGSLGHPPFLCLAVAGWEHLFE